MKPLRLQSLEQIAADQTWRNVYLLYSRCSYFLESVVAQEVVGQRILNRRKSRTLTGPLVALLSPPTFLSVTYRQSNLGIMIPPTERKNESCAP